MKNNLKTRIILITVVLIAVLSVTSFASAFSVNMTLNSTSRLKAGDYVVVTLKISSINAGNGIDAILATLDYDKDVFEEVTEENFDNLNRWRVGLYYEVSQKFTVLRSSKVNTPGDILKITLKVKDNINVNSTKITIKDISASGGAIINGGTGDIHIPEASVIIYK